MEVRTLTSFWRELLPWWMVILVFCWSWLFGVHALNSESTYLRPKYTSLCTRMRGTAYSARDANFIIRIVCAGCTCTLNSLAVISLSARWTRKQFLCHLETSCWPGATLVIDVIHCGHIVRPYLNMFFLQWREKSPQREVNWPELQHIDVLCNDNI